MESIKKATPFWIIVLLVFSITACSNDSGSSLFRPSTITSFNIVSRQAAYEGKAFGTVGQYELILAQATGVINPRDPKNSGIVNLDKAPKNKDGMVEYTVDVHILKPVDMTKGNNKIVYDVVNRGGKMALSTLNGQTAWTSAGSGLDFLQNSGYTLVWSGWQGDVAMPAVPLATSVAGTSFPIAVKSDGSDITGLSREEFVDKAANPFTGVLTYPAATADKTGVTLTVRQNEKDARTIVPAANWDYVAGSNNQQILVTKVPGYDMGALYEFIYTAKSPTVMGIGFAAVRDVVSFLRFSTAASNPLNSSTINKAIIFGISQSGRFIRDFIYQGFNLNTNGKVVFEGALPVVAGARRTFTNYAFAQPGRFTRQHEDHLYPQGSFPFTYGTLTDALSGQTDGIFAKCTSTTSCPRLFHFDTDSEVWQGYNSLIVTDTAGVAITLPDNVRVFLMAGRCHAPGTSPTGVQAVNSLPYGAPLRALLLSLDNWISNGTTPLASKWPSLADGSYVSLATAQTQWPAGIPSWPWLNLINTIEVRDYSVLPPVITSAAYPLYVPRFDADGNTLTGLVYPEISVPVGTYSGRSTRKTGFAPGEMNNILGGYRQFELTAAARAISGDPRLSLEERYPGADAAARNADYQAKLKIKADELAAQGYMLPMDAPAYYTRTLPTGAPTP